ncbi:ATP-dependent carboxylate-amine ligase [Roseibium sp. SCPC15]|uniref:ATP-dependent carboxylate-amine ligase n=1 Tax=Roseibium sp. SCP15 TaxID=3141376 RepID=UPI00333BB158
MTQKGSTDARDPDNRSLVFQLLERFCAQRDLRLFAGDPYGHAGVVEGPAGKRWYFKGTRFDLNGLGASEIANDKAYAATFLAEGGITVPDSHFVFSEKIRDGRPIDGDLLAFAREKKFPLFVKPNIGQEGRDVTRVDTLSVLETVLQNLSKDHEHLLVQPEIRGREFRIVILDGEVLCAIERKRPVVIGNGVSPVSELLSAHAKLSASDSRVSRELAAQGLELESVPENGQEVTVLPVTNLSRGGTARIVTADIAPEIIAIVRHAAEILSLRYAGVDVIVPESLSSGNKAVVLEVNAAPGLSNLARQGTEESALVERIYDKIFTALFDE